MASSAITLSVVATSKSSLVVAPVDIGAHWDIELEASLERLARSRNVVVRSGAYVIRDQDTTVESIQWEDWEFARIDWPATDLAAAVAVLALQPDGTIDQRIAEETVSGYVDAGGRDESHALDPLLRQFLLAVALHARTRRAAGESWNPEFQDMIESALARFV